MAMTMHQRARLSRGVQYAVLILVVLALIAVADWPLLVEKVFNPAIAAQQFPGIIVVALKNTLIYTLLGFVVGLTLVGSNADENFYVPGAAANSTKFLGKDGVVLSVKKTF